MPQEVLIELSRTVTKLTGYSTNVFLRMAIRLLVALLLLTGLALSWTNIHTPCPRVKDTSDPTPRLPLRRGQHPLQVERGQHGHPSRNHPAEDTPSDASPPAVGTWNHPTQNILRIAGWMRSISLAAGLLQAG